MHYINENEDVLVSLEKIIPEGFYRIPSLDSYWLNIALFNKSLYVAAMCYSEAYKEFNEDTADMTYCKWLTKHGYKEPSINHHLVSKQIYELAGNFKNYDMFDLSCRYGGNYRNFNILKSFIVPKDYIIANYDSKKINKFIQGLLDDKFICGFNLNN